MLWADKDVALGPQASEPRSGLDGPHLQPLRLASPWPAHCAWQSLMHVPVRARPLQLLRGMERCVESLQVEVLSIH